MPRLKTFYGIREENFPYGNINEAPGFYQMIKLRERISVIQAAAPISCGRNIVYEARYPVSRDWVRVLTK